MKKLLLLFVFCMGITFIHSCQDDENPPPPPDLEFSLDREVDKVYERIIKQQYSINVLDLLTAPIDEKTGIIKFDSRITSWDQTILNDPKYDRILLVPASVTGYPDTAYLKYGKLDFTVSGTDDKFRIIQYYNPEKRDFTYEEFNNDPKLIVDYFDLLNQSNVLLHGLFIKSNSFEKSFDSRTGETYIITGTGPVRIANATNIVLDGCVVENSLSGIRLFNISNCYIQNNSFRDKVNAPADLGSLQLTAYANMVSENNRIVNNVFKNLTDGVALTYNHKFGQQPPFPDNSQTGIVRSNLIAGNIILITKDIIQERACSKSRIVGEDGEPFLYDCSCAEGGFDVKTGMGSDDMRFANIFENNVLYGFRPTNAECGGTGDSGTGFVLHNNANGHIIRENLFYDMTIAFSIEGPQPDKFPVATGAKNIQIYGNVVANLVDVWEGASVEVPDGGVTFRFSNNLDSKTANIGIYNNIVYNAPHVFSFTTEKKAEEYLTAFVGKGNKFRKITKSEVLTLN